MLIVSDFHDYYDMIQKYGVDTSVVYQRKETEILSALTNSDELLKKLPYISDTLSEWRGGKGIGLTGLEGFHTGYGLIGFCGIIIPFVSVHKREWNKVYQKELCVRDATHLFSAEEVEDFVESCGTKKEKAEFTKTTKRKWLRSHQYYVNEFFDYFDAAKDDFVFRMFKTPIFAFHNAYGKERLYLNPSLKEYQFFKVEDPYNAYQKIYQYISGVLGVGETETLNISDEDMLVEKGFFKWSFKTLPGTKKPRRKNKK